MVEHLHSDTDSTTTAADATAHKEAERLRSDAATVYPYAYPESVETIGLLGVRSSADRESLPRSSRYKRMAEMLAIVRKYEIVKGLTPQSLRRMLEELGPTFVKAGQILSMRSEILPEAFCKELARLRTAVEPMPYETVLNTLADEYQRPLEEIFLSIDNKPLGSASVAQVHRAYLLDGQVVAIKVQRPGVRATMAQDISIMRSIAKQTKRIVGEGQLLDIQSVVEEIWQSFREETDFLVEARSLEEFRSNNADFKFVNCPRPIMSLCSNNVVVMEYVDGIPITNFAELEAAGYDKNEIGVKLVDNYASQVLDQGFFHADPHPGNIMVADGKIEYIDLGIMGRLSPHDRAAVGDIVFSVGEYDSERLMNSLLRFAVETDADINHAHLLADLDMVLSDYGTTNLGDLDLPQLLSSVMTLASNNGIQLPGTVTMLVRSLVTLEGTVEDMLANESIVEIIAKHIEGSKGLPDLIGDEVSLYAREFRAASHGLLKASSEASLAMRMLTRGQLRMNVSVPGSKNPIADFSHAFDRLTMGIVLAGLFIGSSVIYYSGVRPLVFGIPVLGLVGFLTALVLGVWLIVDIIREGKGKRR
ncbi:MAG: lipopolysaccharide core heptose(II) kinase RfaY [Coriobacteriales bacterium]|nr:lipopolysaccharide core heptose(II) kinase RfaY [Coriobacteriales bacterium]